MHTSSWVRVIAGCTIASALIVGGIASAQQGAPPGAPAQGGPSFPRVPPLPFPQAPQTFTTLTHSIRVVPYVPGLANPWSLTFLPNRDILVTEKPGRLRIVRNGVLDPQPIAGVPQVHALGQGGLLEVALHPRFAGEPADLPDVLEAGRPWEYHGSAARPLRRHGAHRRQGHLRRRCLVHRQRTLRLQARLRPRRHALHDRR